MAAATTPFEKALAKYLGRNFRRVHEDYDKLKKTVASFDDVKVSDRGLIWTS